MSQVWLCIPSCRPLAECGPRFEKWRAMGYRLALLRQGESVGSLADVSFGVDKYAGWAKSTNILAKYVLVSDPTAQWIVGGGDDTLPDPNYTADEIATQCGRYFYTERWKRNGGYGSSIGCCDTFGVMQPTGDRWCDTPQSRAQFGEDRGAMIDRIAGSPWMGREWCTRSYQGRGPMPDMHYHCWADEELQCVAERLGVFWQRRDLCHMHEHWLRDNPNITPDRVVPQSWPIAALDYVNGRALFEERKRLGFPGSNPLEAR